MRRQVSLAALFIGLFLLGLMARPASACWYCQQKLICNPNGGGCQLFAICNQASGFCTDCAVTCTEAPGLCNHNAGDQCQFALNAVDRSLVWSPEALLAMQQRPTAS
jgi:hypothetical protein